LEIRKGEKRYEKGIKDIVGFDGSCIDVAVGGPGTNLWDN
jgi:hypothetical protein